MPADQHCAIETRVSSARVYQRDGFAPLAGPLVFIVKHIPLPYGKAEKQVAAQALLDAVIGLITMDNAVEKVQIAAFAQGLANVVTEMRDDERLDTCLFALRLALYNNEAVFSIQEFAGKQLASVLSRLAKLVAIPASTEPSFWEGKDYTDERRSAFAFATCAIICFALHANDDTVDALIRVMASEKDVARVTHQVCAEIVRLCALADGAVDAPPLDPTTVEDIAKCVAHVCSMCTTAERTLSLSTILASVKFASVIRESLSRDKYWRCVVGVLEDIRDSGALDASDSWTGPSAPVEGHQSPPVTALFRVVFPTSAPLADPHPMETLRTAWRSIARPRAQKYDLCDTAVDMEGHSAGNADVQDIRRAFSDPLADMYDFNTDVLLTHGVHDLQPVKELQEHLTDLCPLMDGANIAVVADLLASTPFAALLLRDDTSRAVWVLEVLVDMVCGASPAVASTDCSMYAQTLVSTTVCGWWEPTRASAATVARIGWRLLYACGWDTMDSGRKHTPHDAFVRTFTTLVTHGAYAAQLDSYAVYCHGGADGYRAVSQYLVGITGLLQSAEFPFLEAELVMFFVTAHASFFTAHENANLVGHMYMIDAMLWYIVAAITSAGVKVSCSASDGVWAGLMLIVQKCAQAGVSIFTGLTGRDTDDFVSSVEGRDVMSALGGAMPACRSHVDHLRDTQASSSFYLFARAILDLAKDDRANAAAALMTISEGFAGSAQSLAGALAAIVHHWWFETAKKQIRRPSEALLSPSTGSRESGRGPPRHSDTHAPHGNVLPILYSDAETLDGGDHHPSHSRRHSSTRQFADLSPAYTASSASPPAMGSRRVSKTRAGTASLAIQAVPGRRASQSNGVVAKKSAWAAASHSASDPPIAKAPLSPDSDAYKFLEVQEMKEEFPRAAATKHFGKDEIASRTLATHLWDSNTRMFACYDVTKASETCFKEYAAKLASRWKEPREGEVPSIFPQVTRELSLPLEFYTENPTPQKRGPYRTGITALDRYLNRRASRAASKELSVRLPSGMQTQSILTSFKGPHIIPKETDRVLQVYTLVVPFGDALAVILFAVLAERSLKPGMDFYLHRKHKTILFTDQEMRALNTPREDILSAAKTAEKFMQAAQQFVHEIHESLFVVYNGAHTTFADFPEKDKLRSSITDEDIARRYEEELTFEAGEETLAGGNGDAVVTAGGADGEPPMRRLRVDEQGAANHHNAPMDETDAGEEGGDIAASDIGSEARDLAEGRERAAPIVTPGFVALAGDLPGAFCRDLYHFCLPAQDGIASALVCALNNAVYPDLAAELRDAGFYDNESNAAHVDDKQILATNVMRAMLTGATLAVRSTQILTALSYEAFPTKDGKLHTLYTNEAAAVHARLCQQFPKSNLLFGGIARGVGITYPLGCDIGLHKITRGPIGHTTSLQNSVTQVRKALVDVTHARDVLEGQVALSVHNKNLAVAAAQHLLGSLMDADMWAQQQAELSQESRMELDAIIQRGATLPTTIPPPPQNGSRQGALRYK